MDAETAGHAAGLRPAAGPLALAAALLLRQMRADPADPNWPDRDRLLVADAALAASLPAEPMPGQALATGLGVAMAERLMAARFGRSLVDHRCWVLPERAELATGPAQEAAEAAGTLKLERLRVLVAIESQDAPVLARFAALGWCVRRADAAQAAALTAAFGAAARARRPTLIAVAGTAAAAPDAENAPPDGSAAAVSARRAWLRRLQRHAARGAFERAVSGVLPVGWAACLAPRADAAPVAVAQAAADAVARLAGLLPELAGRHAVPPLALAHALNGMALHQGVLPLATMDAAEAEALGPALRAAAARRLRVVHLVREPVAACPVGGLKASWRAMANLHVHRPGDADEARACLEVALRRNDGPGVLLLGAAGTAAAACRDLRMECAQGGRVVVETAGVRSLTLIASGPELGVALAARAALAARGLRVAVVSLPCWELFARQPAEWRAAVLGDAPRFGIEAGSGFGWERWLGPAGHFIGPKGSGKVSPQDVEHFVCRTLRPGNSPSEAGSEALASLAAIR